MRISRAAHFRRQCAQVAIARDGLAETHLSRLASLSAHITHHLAAAPSIDEWRNIVPGCATLQLHNRLNTPGAPEKQPPQEY